MTISEKIDKLTGEVLAADSFREKNSRLIHFLCEMGWCEEKKEDYTESNDIVILWALDSGMLNEIEICYTMLLKNPSSPDYYPSELVGPVTAQNMCANILTGIKEDIEENKLQVDDVVAFSNSFFNLIDAVFPHGFGYNRENYGYEFKYYSISESELDKNEYPSLERYWNCRKFIITELIDFLLFLTNKESFHLAMEKFHIFGEKYEIGNRTFLWSFWEPFMRMERPEIMGYVQSFYENDLVFLLRIVESEIFVYSIGPRLEQFKKEAAVFQKFLKNDMEKSKDSFKIIKEEIGEETQNRIECAVNTLLNTKLECLKHVNPNSIITFYKQMKEFDDVFRYFNLSEETKYYLSILRRDYSEMKIAYRAVVEKLDFLKKIAEIFQNFLNKDMEESEDFFKKIKEECDEKTQRRIMSNVKALSNTKLECLKIENLNSIKSFFGQMKKFSDVYTYFELSERTKTFLNYSIEKYSVFSPYLEEDIYLSSLGSIRETIIDALDLIEKNRMNNLLEEMSSVSSEDIRKYCLDFFSERQKVRNDNDATNDDLYKKIKEDDELVKLIAGAQKFIEPFKKIDPNISGDYTFLIVTQVKLVERFLKTCIINNMQGKSIFPSYDFKTGQPKSNKLPLHIQGGMTWENLSGKESEKISDNISIELATAAFIIYNNKDSVKSPDVDDSTFKKFFDWKNTAKSNQAGFLYWKDKVRNGYFHTHPVETIGDALDIHKKTSFCLSQCIYLLKPIHV